MSLTELKVVITEQNAAIVADFIAKLHAPKEVKSLTELAKVMEVVDAEEVKAETEAPKKEPAKRASRSKKPEPVEEEDELEDAKEAVEDNAITADDLRGLQAEKVGAHRDAIIKKLNGLGAKNITSLDESKFTEYYNFLAELA